MSTGEIIKLKVSDKDLDRNQPSLPHARKAFTELYADEAEATISVVAYNRLETTKRCVESILKYTTGVKYKLILAYNDNEAGQGILEYYESVDYDNKLIIHVERNTGAALAYKEILKHIEGKYYVGLANDLIVTTNWLTNLIKCAESDPRIGMVNPVSSNASNLQGVQLNFSNYEELQAVAAKFNVSNPARWEERIRLVTLGTLITRDCLDALGNVFDTGFFHDFGDDEISFRARRAGYKCMVAGDTWIHHDHDFSSRDPKKLAQSIEAGKKNFSEKYFGLDAWADSCNFRPEYASSVKKCTSDNPSVLGVDVRCGTPLLELKNTLRKSGTFNTELFAYTQASKYYLDLQTVCGPENVGCGVPECLLNRFGTQKFDYIILGENINTYKEPMQLLKNMAGLLKEDGQLFVSLKNTHDFFSFVYEIGCFNVGSPERATDYSLEQFVVEVRKQGLNAKFITRIPYADGAIPKEDISSVTTMVSGITKNKLGEVMGRLLTDRYAFEITKG